jgi:hypothetical protein
MIQHIQRMLKGRVIEIRVFPLPAFPVLMNHDPHLLPPQGSRCGQRSRESSSRCEKGTASHAASENVLETEIIPLT